MQDAVINTDTAGLPTCIAMTPQTMLMGTIDLEELNPQFRQAGENNCRSIKQAADWFRTNEPSTKESPNQLDKLKQAAKAGGIQAIPLLRAVHSGVLHVFCDASMYLL